MEYIKKHNKYVYGHLRKYKDYVWKHNETYGICMEISRHMQNMYGNL